MSITDYSTLLYWAWTPSTFEWEEEHEIATLHPSPPTPPKEKKSKYEDVIV